MYVVNERTTVGVFRFCLSAPHTIEWRCNIDMCRLEGPNSMFYCIHLSDKFGGRHYMCWIHKYGTRVPNTGVVYM